MCTIFSQWPKLFLFVGLIRVGRVANSIRNALSWRHEAHLPTFRVLAHEPTLIRADYLTSDFHRSTWKTKWFPNTPGKFASINTRSIAKRCLFLNFIKSIFPGTGPNVDLTHKNWNMCGYFDFFHSSEQIAAQTDTWNKPNKCGRTRFYRS